MTATPLEVLTEFPTNSWDQERLPKLAERLVAEDISLNFDDQGLNRIMPWVGTKHGRGAFVFSAYSPGHRATAVTPGADDAPEVHARVGLYRCPMPSGGPA